MFECAVVAGQTSTVQVSTTNDWLRSNAVGGWMVQYTDPTPGSTYDKKVWRIDSTWDDFVQPKYVEGLALSSIVAAGGTLSFFPPRMILPYSSVSASYASGIQQRYMRVELRATDDNQLPFGETEFGVGRVVAGMTLPFTVPLDWKHVDSEEQNVDLFQSSTGMRESYKKGDTRRTFSGRVVGDVDRWRDAFRGTLRTVSQYSAHPLVLVPDGDNANMSMIYSRFMGEGKLENPAWKYNETTSTWEPVGDIAVVFEEEL